MTDEGIGPPQAWLRSRPWGRDVARLLDGHVDGEILRVIEKVRAKGDDTQFLADMAGMVAVRSLRSMAADHAAVVREMAMASLLHAWLEQGAETFRFGGVLTEELLHTDIDDVLCGEISFPYRAFYLTFNAQMKGSHAPHGMMLNVIEDADGRTLRMLPMYDQIPNIGEDMDTSPGIHVKMVPDRPFIDQLNDAVQYSLDVAASGVVEADQGRPAIRIVVSDAETKIRQYQSLKPFIPLVVNGLLYIDQCRNEIVPGWPEAAPSADVIKAQSGGTGHRKAEQRLRSRGWTPIRICEIPAPDVDEAGRTGSGRTIEAHWRRGHWRRQGYGPGRELVRRIRIRPVRVRGYATSTKAEVHVRDYAVLEPREHLGDEKEDR